MGSDDQRSFSSNADEIRFYIKQVLDGGAEKSTTEIHEYVRNAAAGKEFTQAMIAGALNDLLVREDIYQRIRRGIYQKASCIESKEVHLDKYDLVLKDTITRLISASMTDIRTLTPETFLEEQNKVKKYIDTLQQLLDEPV